MPIRNQIEAITQTLTEQPTFIYGTVNEINSLADDASFPCVFMYPLQPISFSRWQIKLERWGIHPRMVLSE